MYVCMYVCMYTCTHAFVQMTCIVRLFWMQDTTDDTIPSVNNSRKPGKKTGGSGNPLPPPPKKKSKGRFGYMYTCSISNVC